MIKRPTFWVCTLLVLLAGGARGQGEDPGESHADGTYRDTARWEEDIQGFEAEAAADPPPEGAIVFYGSSRVRMWHERIEEDLAPLTVIKRGFGGSNMNDALTFLDRVVIPYAPRAVVLYEGDNDVEQGISPALIRDTFVKLVQKIHEALPETRVYFLSIKPSIDRQAMWPTMVEANASIKDLCDDNELLIYLDVATSMLAEDGTPRPDIFIDDDLHMNDKGYDLWRAAVRPVLIDAEHQFEK